MYFPGANLWARLRVFLALTTTDFIVQPPLSGGKFIVRQPGGVAGVDQVEISHNGSQIVINNPDGINGILLQNNGSSILSTSNNNGICHGTSFLIGSTQLQGLACSLSGIIDAQGGNSAVHGGVRNTWDVALNTAFTNATTTFTNTILSRTLLAGVTYKIEGYLHFFNSTAGNGAKFDFNGGTATDSGFNICFNPTNATASGVSSTLAGSVTFATAGAVTRVFLTGFIKVNAGGTVIMRAAENSTGGGLLTLNVGSWLTFTPLVQV